LQGGFIFKNIKRGRTMKFNANIEGVEDNIDSLESFIE